MYVTAHRVETPGNSTGVNSYLFLHFDDPVPMLRPEEPDVAYVAQFAAGTCVAEKEDVRPGGNTVKCSLDVVGCDDASAVSVRRVVAELRAQLQRKLPPLRAVTSGLAAAFNATLDFDEDPVGRLAAFDDLSSRVLAMLPLRSKAHQPRGPLVVWVQYRAEGIELSLPSATRARLGSSIAHRMKAVLPAEVVAHFPGKGREALLDVATALTGKNRDQLRRAGGLVFVDPTTEAEVQRWPEALSSAQPSAPPVVSRKRGKVQRRRSP
ncbi:MAG: hypothetical protein K8T90_02160 [Planctomycetes bacterium]|nr:hypothetical protein [Planctomycetota bacterium]